MARNQLCYQYNITSAVLCWSNKSQTNLASRRGEANPTSPGKDAKGVAPFLTYHSDLGIKWILSFICDFVAPRILEPL
jgi:hypothetical protein